MKPKLAMSVEVVRECLPAAHVREYSLNDDDVYSVFADICEHLATSGCAGFLVAGFGDDRWPVDLHTDLLTAIRQLRDASVNLERRLEFRFDFYEQGVERFLSFEPVDGAEYRVACTSGTSWVPEPASFRLPIDDVAQTFSELRNSFLEAARRACPGLAEHPWVSEWVSSFGRRF